MRKGGGVLLGTVGLPSPALGVSPHQPPSLRLSERGGLPALTAVDKHSLLPGVGVGAHGREHRLPPPTHTHRNVRWTRRTPGPSSLQTPTVGGHPAPQSSGRATRCLCAGPGLGVGGPPAWLGVRPGNGGPRGVLTPASSGRAHEVGVSQDGASGDFGTRLGLVLGSDFDPRKRGGAFFLSCEDPSARQLHTVPCPASGTGVTAVLRSWPPGAVPWSLRGGPDLEVGS